MAAETHKYLFQNVHDSIALPSARSTSNNSPNKSFSFHIYFEAAGERTFLATLGMNILRAENVLNGERGPVHAIAAAEK